MRIRFKYVFEFIGYIHNCKLSGVLLKLHAKPLLELNWQDLGIYLFKAMTTCGDIEDFKHFLPRILELYVIDYYGAIYDIFIVFEKLNYACWHTWDLNERDAILALFNEWLNELDPNDKENEYGASPYEEVLDSLVHYDLHKLPGAVFE